MTDEITSKFLKYGKDNLERISSELGVSEEKLLEVIENISKAMAILKYFFKKSYLKELFEKGDFEKFSKKIKRSKRVDGSSISAQQEARDRDESREGGFNRFLDGIV